METSQERKTDINSDWCIKQQVTRRVDDIDMIFVVHGWFRITYFQRKTLGIERKKV